MKKKVTRVESTAVQVLPKQEVAAAVSLFYPGHDGAHTAQAVIEQWRRAQKGLLELIRFGAMLIDLEDYLIIPRGDYQDCTSHGGDRKSGTGLKGWLEENCPELNYKTAMGYVAAARNLKMAAMVRDEVPLLAVLDAVDVDAALAEERGRVMAVIQGSTLRELKSSGTGRPAEKRESSNLPVTAEMEMATEEEMAHKISDQVDEWMRQRNWTLVRDVNVLESVASCLRAAADNLREYLRRNR